MTPPDLTPEQMNERLVSDFCALIENRCGTVRGIGPAVREGLPKLFAAWQEQTAAKAGEPPEGSRVLACDADYEDGVRCVVMPCCGFTFDATHVDDHIEPEIYVCPLCEGAAAGVAASETRVRELREALEYVREKASTLVASTLTTALPAAEFIEDAYDVANGLDALAALLSEEPGGG